MGVGKGKKVEPTLTTHTQYKLQTDYGEVWKRQTSCEDGSPSPKLRERTSNPMAGNNALNNNFLMSLSLPVFSLSINLHECQKRISI